MCGYVTLLQILFGLSELNWIVLALRRQQLPVAAAPRVLVCLESSSVSARHRWALAKRNLNAALPL